MQAAPASGRAVGRSGRGGHETEALRPSPAAVLTGGYFGMRPKPPPITKGFRAARRQSRLKGGQETQPQRAHEEEEGKCLSQGKGVAERLKACPKPQKTLHQSRLASECPSHKCSEFGRNRCEQNVQTRGTFSSQGRLTLTASPAKPSASPGNSSASTAK